MLLQNVLFRCGGAAILLSNKWLDGRRALAKLMHCVRVQGVDDASYACVCPPARVIRTEGGESAFETAHSS